jgi:hypothetical protein
MENPKYPTTKDLDEAIGYFVDAGFIQEMTSDKQYYTKILLQHAANFSSATASRALKQHIELQDA